MLIIRNRWNIEQWKLLVRDFPTWNSTFHSVFPPFPYPKKDMKKDRRVGTVESIRTRFRFVLEGRMLMTSTTRSRL